MIRSKAVNTEGFLDVSDGGMGVDIQGCYRLVGSVEGGWSVGSSDDPINRSLVVAIGWSLIGSRVTLVHGICFVSCFFVGCYVCVETLSLYVFTL